MRGGIFLPVRTGKHKPVRVEPEAEFFSGGQAQLHQARTPFFYIMTADGTARKFLEAVANSPDTLDFRAYMSKTFHGQIELSEIRAALQSGGRYKCLTQALFRSSPPHCKTNSIALFQEDTPRHTIVHLHMIREPDRFGQWKIFGIEKE